VKNVLSAAAVAALVLLMLTGSALSAPKMMLPETEFDFGYVPQNSKVSHVFWIHSTGDDTLKILKVTPG
jgi:hypothetical protein